MKLKAIIILIFVIGAIIAGVFFISKLTNNQEKKIEKLNDEIAFLKTETQPIRFKVTDRKNGETTVLVKFYNLENKEIGKKEFTMKGTTISFDFYVVKFDNGYVAFPYKIFSDEIQASNGTLLYDFYEKNNFPMTFFKDDASKNFKEGIKALYEKIKAGNIENIDNIFGSMVQNNASATTNNRDIDVWYKIIVHTAGGIEIIED